MTPLKQISSETSKDSVSIVSMSEGVKDRISIVIPAYNEEIRLPTTIRNIKSFFIKLALDIEVIIVVEKSADNTLALARQCIDDDSIKTHARFRLIDNKIHRGKGYAVKSGVKQATGEYIFFCDADLAIPLTEVLRFLAEFQKDPKIDILIANRKHNKSSIKRTFIRRKFGETFNIIIKKLMGLDIQDTQCGFKAFRHNVAKAIFSSLKCDHFAFDVEVLLLAKHFQYTCHSRPVICLNEAQGSSVNLWLDPFKMLKDLISIKYRISKMSNLKPIK